MKKLFSIILAICLAVAVTSCKDEPSDDIIPDEPQDTAQKQEYDITLAYCPNEKLNVYNIMSQLNYNVLSLVFDNLFYLDNEFEPYSDLVKDYTIFENTASITLNDIYFSNGAKLSAADVIYSLNTAKKSKRYSELLKDVKSAEGKGNAVTITYTRPACKRLLSALCFPIVKEKNEGVGTGRYVLKTSPDMHLEKNGHHTDNENIKRNIMLYGISDVNTIYNNLNISQINAVYTKLDERNVAFSGANEIHSYTTNNLVYVGINTNKYPYSNADVRSALSVGLNREQIADNALSIYATPTWQPFNTHWQPAGELNNSIYSLMTAKQLLEEAGAVYKEDKLFFGANNAKAVIIVNKENETRVEVANAVANNLSALGIEATVEQLSFSEYNKRISSHNYTMYIGEMKIPYTNDITCLWDRSVSTAYADKNSIDDMLSQLDKGEIEIDSIVSAFEQESPFLPLYYMNAGVMVSKHISGTIEPTEQQIFNNITTWRYSH